MVPVPLAAVAVALISSPAELPVTPSPGLVVLITTTPSATAAELAELLDAPAPCTPSEAAAELDRRTHEGASDTTASAEEDRRAALEIARLKAAEASQRVPPEARGATAGRLFSAAAAVRAAEEATAHARALLGERPDLAVDAAEAALAAEQAVASAREQRVEGIDRSSTLLLVANAVGFLIIAGRMGTPVVDPLFVLVAVCPLAALAHLLVTVFTRTREARAASRLRAELLRSTGMSTMAGLLARQNRLKAWTARAEGLAAAEASLAQARRRWVALAGASVDPADVGALVEAVGAAERAAEAVAKLEAGVPARPAEPVRGPIVLVDGCPDLPLDGETRSLLERVDGEGAHGGLIVVTACTQIASWAQSRTGDPVPAEVVDIRERILASLERLRARADGFRDASPPGPMAAGG